MSMEAGRWTASQTNKQTNKQTSRQAAGTTCTIYGRQARDGNQRIWSQSQSQTLKYKQNMPKDDGTKSQKQKMID